MKRHLPPVLLLAALACGHAHAQKLTLSPLSAPALAGRHIWDLQLANGMRSRWETADGKAGALQDGQSLWYRAGELLGSRALRLFASRGAYLAEVTPSREERDMAADLAAFPELDEALARLAALTDRIAAECGDPDTARGDAQLRCVAPFEARIHGAQQAVAAQRAAREAKLHAVGAACSRLRLRIDNGAVTGMATCQGREGISVTGTLRAAD